MNGEFRAVLWIGLGGDDWESFRGLVSDETTEAGIRSWDCGLRGVVDLWDCGGKHAECDFEFDLHWDQYSRLGEVEEEPAEEVCAGSSLTFLCHVLNYPFHSGFVQIDLS